MNISSQLPSLPIATVNNPATDTLRRENNLRELITQPTAASPSTGEKGVASEKERARTPAQNNEQVDFSTLKKRAEQENSTISDSGEQNQPSDQQKQQNEQSQQSDKNPAEVFAEEKHIHQLQQRDQEVRTHERAHAAVGGAVTGTPSFTFEVGPDGKKYASSGEVSVDLSRVKGNPRATIAKMQKVHAAALAPANPSIQDTRVAAAAANIITQSQAELFSTDVAQPNKDPEDSENSRVISNSSSSIRATGDIKASQVFNNDSSAGRNNSDNEYDNFINKTLHAQEQIAPSQSQDVKARAGRIENFYLKINQAYEKPNSYQFQLTA